MDKDLSITYAMISTLFGLFFGVEIGVGFWAMGGAFLSLRFCETKGTWPQFGHFIISVVLACMIVGGTHKLYPPWLSLRLMGLLLGFLGLIFAEKIYKAARDTNFTDKLNTIIDKAIAKWMP